MTGKHRTVPDAGLSMPAFITEPHGEHTVTCVDQDEGGIWEIEDHEGKTLAFTDEELDSLAAWWANRRGARILGRLA